jgi:glycosyltransferase involved in cell wall biosynthesis
VTVSVNLCCYNGEPFLADTLDSIVRQEYSDWELVIVDDGSTDETPRIVAGYQGHGWPIVYHRQSNEGLGRARNAALALSRGEFIAFIDQDDPWLPAKLRKQIPLFADERVGLVYSDAHVVNTDGRVTGLFSHADARRLVRGNPRDSLLAFGGFFSVSTAVVRKSVIDKVGGFESTLNFVEDTDMWFRIAERWMFECCAEPLATYRIHPNSGLRKFPERHWAEAIQLSRREIGKSNAAGWARKAAIDRLLDLSWSYARWLQRHGRPSEAVRALVGSAKVAPVRSGVWFAKKLACSVE